MYIVSHSEGRRRKMLVHKSRIRLLPLNRKLDSIESDGPVAVARKTDPETVQSEQVNVQESGKLRKPYEHPTLVKEARDHSDNEYFDLGTKERENRRPESRKFTGIPAAPKKHGMTLRKRN